MVGVTLYVGNLDKCVTGRQLGLHFLHHAPAFYLNFCVVVKDSQTDKSPGYGFVEYPGYETAAEALELADSTLLMDKPIHVLFSPFHHDLSPSVIFIKNLPKLVTRKALFHLLKYFGNLISLNLATDASGYATARYNCVEAAQSAITALNGNLLSNNKRLYVSSFLMVPVYGSPQRAYNKLFLRIHDGISKKFIRETLSPFGAVINVCITESFPKGDLFADVTMEDSKAADRAAAALVPHRPGLLYLGRIQEDTSTFRPLGEMDAKMIITKQLHLNLFQDQEETSQLHQPVSPKIWNLHQLLRSHSHVPT